MTDQVARPAHYTFSAVEPIDVIEAWGLNFARGAVVKYLARAGRKGGAAREVQDLRKARWFLSREIRRLRVGRAAHAGRTVVLGQAPSATSDPERPLRGRPLSVMASAAGMTPAEFAAAFELRNVLQVYPGKGADGRGDAFPRAEAGAAARVLLAELQGRRVLLLGGRVSELFGLRGKVARMVWTEHRGITVAALPHPSGLTRWWNDPVNRSAAGAFLKEEAGRHG